MDAHKERLTSGLGQWPLFVPISSPFARRAVVLKHVPKARPGTAKLILLRTFNAHRHFAECHLSLPWLEIIDLLLVS